MDELEYIGQWDGFPIYKDVAGQCWEDAATGLRSIPCPLSNLLTEKPDVSAVVTVDGRSQDNSFLLFGVIGLALLLLIRR